MRGVDRLVLATQQPGRLAGEPAQDDVGGVDDVPLTLDLALCTARFALHSGGAVVASGPFTLILQKRGDRWQILHDHTSSDPK